MKQIIIYCCVLVGWVSSSVLAQTTFAEDQSYWKSSTQLFTGPPQMGYPVYYTNYHQFLHGDTIVQGKIYQKVYRKTYTANNASPPPLNPADLALTGYYYYDSSRVYYGVSPDSVELLYDFNLTASDSFPMNIMIGTSPCTVEHVKVSVVDSVLLGGKYRKRIQFATLTGGISGNTYIQWIEGIGERTYGPFLDPCALQAINGSRSLVCFNEGGNPVIGTCANIGLNEKNDNNAILAYPNPCDRLIHLQVTEPIRRVSIINILAYEVAREIHIDKSEISIKTSDLPEGIYFINIETNNGLVTKKVIVLH